MLAWVFASAAVCPGSGNNCMLVGTVGGVMLTLMGWLNVRPCESITEIIVELYSVAITVGVPDKTPDCVLNDKPGGNFPVSAHVKGDVPPTMAKPTLKYVFTGADTVAGVISVIAGYIGWDI